MDSAGPFITGRGLVSALGGSLAGTWESLISGDSIRTHSPARLAKDKRWPRVTQLAIHAAREAIDEARWGSDVLKDNRTALLVGTSRGPVNEWLSATQNEPIGIHTVAGQVARELKIGSGPRLTYSAACASSLHALVRSTLMLRSGEADRALVIGPEASLHPLFLACFKRLGVLPSEAIGCRPFDRLREGFLVSEAAAAVCLEMIRPAKPNVAITRCALGGDASTITSSDPIGTVISTLLGRIIGNDRIDLIHAHGTGTIANDPVELAAIEANCSSQDDSPALYSHKGALGHSLGASGLMSVALSSEMHARGIVLPNVRTVEPLPTTHVRLSAAIIERPIRKSICMAAGFGGPVAAVALAST